MHDAIIVGARCAGSPLGMLLARQGYDVLVVDRATFPSDTLSTHAFAGDAGERMQRWGLLDKVLATGCTQVRKLIFYINGAPMEIPLDGPIPGIAPRRTVLDMILVDAAREAGAEVREGFSVQELLRDAGGRVTGVRGKLADGSEVIESARIVVGADGRNSFVAKAVEPEEYNTIPPRQCAYYSYWSGFENADAMELHTNDEGSGAFIFPTNDNLVCIGVGFQMDEFEKVRADPEKAVLDALHKFPTIMAKAKNLKREDRMWGWSGYTSYYRKPYGPGWALVGDAGYLKDPTLGQGINDCFRDADYLAEAIDAGFSGKQDLDEALAAYQKRRDDETIQIYRINDLFASRQVSPEMAMALFQGMAEQAQATASAAS